MYVYTSVLSEKWHFRKMFFFCISLFPWNLPRFVGILLNEWTAFDRCGFSVHAKVDYSQDFDELEIWREISSIQLYHFKERRNKK